jgi:heavy metal sensor kinase
MKLWWRRRPLRFRLAVWFTCVSSAILLGLAPVVFWMIERRLHVEFDRELLSDWQFIERQLVTNPAEGVRWRSDDPAVPDSTPYAETWFDVWSGDQSLLRHSPDHAAPVEAAPRASAHRTPVLRTIHQANGLPARTLEQVIRLGGRELVLRVFKDESGLHRTLREVLISFVLGVPLAAMLAAFGGYVMAGRMLEPIGAMAAQARRITSESLHQRLPTPNPHDELGQLAEVFNETLQRLENSFESLRRFTADASHELRTPLTALRAVGEVALRRGSDPMAHRETVESMLEEAQRLNDLIDSMLLLARIEGSQHRPACEHMALHDFMAEVCEGVSVLAAEKKQTIRLTGDKVLHAIADRFLSRQAAINILHNAIRYSPANSKIEVACRRRGSQAIIEIEDEGPGIAPEHHQRVFERFFRVDRARSRSDGGAGLGLAIAKHSIARQGGAIELESSPGQGCRFRIVLPMEPRRD